MSEPWVNQFAWTDEAVAEMARLWRDGWSCSQIARELARKFGGNPSRSAIIGKLHRNGLSRRDQPKVPAPGAVRLRATPTPRVKSEAQPVDRGPLKVGKNGVRPKPSRQAIANSAVLGPGHTATIKPPTPYVERPEPAGKVRPTELRSHHCRWPIGDPNSDTFRHCGDQKQDGSSYCPRHHKRAYIAPKTPPKEFARSLRRYA